MENSIKIKGVDLSYCQKGIDYKKLKDNGVKFAIIRAGYSEMRDSLLDAHVRGCGALGIDIGFYWYSYARTREEALREASACIKAIGDYAKPKYPVFFDAEESALAKEIGKSGMTGLTLAFIEELEKNGYPSGVYANPSWIENFLEKEKVIGKHDIWLAHWTYSPNRASKFSYGQQMWQWGTEKFGNYTVDADICFIDYPEKTAEFYRNFKNSAVTKTKGTDEVAVEVIRGKWSNGAQRKQKLEAAGYDYITIQRRVNEILSGG